MSAPYESVQTVNVRVRDTDDPMKVEVLVCGGGWFRLFTETFPLRPVAMQEAIDAHVASRPQPDPAWGTREEAGDWVGSFVPESEEDARPWCVKKSTDRVTRWLSREEWAAIKREALS